ncbi:hypothetical protein ABFX02_03G071700 [Erythranthe guttata]
MSGNYRFEMEENDVVRSLITTIGSFIEDRLANKEQRIQHKDHCAERLAAEDQTAKNQTEEIHYSDQAVLANLDWGIEALEEAIATSNVETKMARLEYAEKMLQVCAMLHSDRKTAGVPNFYLSAWAHLNLSYLWKLKNDNRNSILHMLEMFVVDPFFSRVDFAPELWRSIFSPHMGSIIGWYSEERRKIVFDMIPDNSDLSLTVDFDHCFNESLILSVRPEQAERIQALENLYGESLDINTRLYAKYYKDCMNYDAANTRKAILPMMPIVEPPMTPLHEISSRLIPDYVKFGPVLPKSAGFSTNQSRDVSSRSKAESASENLEDSDCWDAQNSSPKEYSPKSRRESSRNSSPKTPTVTNSSPKSVKKPGNIQTSMLRLLSTRATDSNSLPISPLSCGDNSSISSTDSDEETKGQLRIAAKSIAHARSVRQTFRKSSMNRSDDGRLSYVSSPTSEVLTPQSRPPKDFVCPITGQIFNDPVTLETGQTYERKAIQEWTNRGNTSCPITRQPLSAAALPKTNYVLKRLITSWKDQHPDIAQEFSSTEIPSEKSALPSRQRFVRAALATSPTSVISQASVETVINALKPYILCLCNSEDLKECEEAVLTVSKIWEDSNVGPGINSYLSSPTIVNGFMEILSASFNKDVLRTTICTLSKLICADDRVRDLLTSIDSDFYCLTDLLKKGLVEAAVLVYLLRPSFSQISRHDLVGTLVRIISDENEEVTDFRFSIAPKDAAIALLEKIVVGGDEGEKSVNATNVVITDNGIPALLSCLDRVDGRQTVVSILLRCMQSDSTCKNVIANGIELSHVLELFHGGDDSVRGMCVEFLCELVRLKRRTSSDEILRIIKEEGTFSTMHTLLVYLQMSPMEQKSSVAILLLQLDLLASPRKMSIYREEAVEAILEALQRKEFPSSQITALGMLSSLAGSLRGSNKPCIEYRLLKIAGFDRTCGAITKKDEMKADETELAETREEERAARYWEKRIAFVLSNHEKGAVFKAMEECFKSNSIEIAKSCLVVSTWLVHMLYSFPDCGTRDVARKSLLDKFVNVLRSSKNLEEKILAALALRGFASEPVGLNEIGVYAKSIWKTLRKIKKSCTAANDITKALMNLPSIDAADLWSCVEGPEIDVSVNGEIMSMIHVRSRLISSHSDGTIKVWDTAKRAPRLIQEAREHSKAVTCLYVTPSCDKLYSGSLDKTIRVWSIKQEEIYCIQVHDVREAVLALAANASVACFSSQGNGVKVYNWSGIVKNIGFNKQAKCLALDGDKLYCGCSGYSVQEVDLKTQSSSTFYSGAKKLLGKQTIHSVEIQDGLLYAGGSSVDGVAGKVFKLSSKAVIGSLPTGLDIQQITVNNDFVFTATKCGIIEVWLKERVAKIAYIKMACGGGGGGSTRITAVASDSDGQKLFAGTSDGRIQVWSLD